MRDDDACRAQSILKTPERFLAALALAAFASGCVPFSEMQGARLTGPGRAEITPQVTRTSFVEDGESADLMNNLGVAIAIGMNKSADFRALIVRSSMVEDPAEGFTAIGFGPKFAWVKDRVALYVPVGFGVGEGIDISSTFQVHPTILFTMPMGSGAEFNTSVKALVPLWENEADPLWGATFGLGLGKDISKFAIRPEIAFLRNPGESGTMISAGLGFTFGFGIPKAAVPRGGR